MAVSSVDHKASPAKLLQTVLLSSQESTLKKKTKTGFFYDLFLNWNLLLIDVLSLGSSSEWFPVSKYFRYSTFQIFSGVCHKVTVSIMACTIFLINDFNPTLRFKKKRLVGCRFWSKRYKPRGGKNEFQTTHVLSFGFILLIYPHGECA